MKVKANKNILAGGGVSIKEAGGVPTIGQEFEITDERFKVLGTKNNLMGKPLVDLVETKDDVEEIVPVEKPKKRKK